MFVSNDNRDRKQPGDGLVQPQTVTNNEVESTPHIENKTYTKVESARIERNLMKKMQQDKYNKAVQIEAKKKLPTSSELLSLSAIDEALRKYHI